MRNLKTTGTFEEYFESIAMNIRQLLDSDEYITTIQGSGSMPTFALIIRNREGIQVHFSITQTEFEKNKLELEILADIKLASILSELKSRRDVYNLTIEKLERR